MKNYHRAHYKIAHKTGLFYRLFRLGKQIGDRDRQRLPLTQTQHLNRMLTCTTDEIIVNPGGQVKIDNLRSCQELCSSDFTVYHSHYLHN